MGGSTPSSWWCLRLGALGSQRLWFVNLSPSSPSTPNLALRPQTLSELLGIWEGGRIQADLGGLSKSSRSLIINALFPPILQLRKLRQTVFCSILDQSILRPSSATFQGCDESGYKIPISPCSSCRAQLKSMSYTCMKYLSLSRGASCHF